jgi:hypothetical protein
LNRYDMDLLPERAVLTLAIGKPLYLDMALNLARSFLWWHRESAIQFCLATDSKEPLPPDLAKIHLIHLKAGQYGEGFSPKLSLDRLAPAQRTLFVDADCLFAGSSEPIFARFAGSAVSVVGGKISTGDWFGDVRAICDRFGVAALPKFNGGIYYLEKGGTAADVYALAREFGKEYDALGLKRLRGWPNDELLMAIAMAVHSLEAIPDDGTIISDPQACQGPLSLDVIRGGSRLINPPAPDPLHQSWYPFQEVSPLVVHFLGDFHESYQYQSAAQLLRFASAGPLTRALGTLYVSMTIRFPGWLWANAKPRLRGVYRSLFGFRALRTSPRL